MCYHAFLSHSSADKPAVKELARRLAKEGIPAWLDKWNLIPGDPWQPAIEKALANRKPVPFSRALAATAPGKTRRCARPLINASAITVGVSA
jgi:TIR domain